MKIAVARGPGQFGGIFRRFREICAHAAGRHDILGLLLLGPDDAPLDVPVRTLSYSRARVSWRVARAADVDDVLEACDDLIAAVAADLARERPDCVLAADTDLKGLAVVAAARRLGIPVTTFVAGFADVEAQFAATRERRPAGLDPLPGPQRDSRAQPGSPRGRHGSTSRYLSLAERFCLESSDALVFPSRFAARHAAARVPRLAPFVVIHNGIAAEFLHAARPAAQVDARRIGAIMRLSPVKNPEALGRIRDALDRRGYALDVVTDSAADAPAAARLLGARFLPQTLDSAALARRYAGWRAVVSPSRFEASGNVPMESIAVGTPAVVTGEMGVAEILEDLGLGHLVVPVDDIEMTVERLVESEAVPDAIRAHVRATFAWPAVCERIVQALQEARV